MMRYRARMKQKESPKGSITKPLLQDLMDRMKAGEMPKGSMPSTEKPPAKQPVQPALYQDAGSGFNSNFDFPQE
jgi:hypothetical protein